MSYYLFWEKAVVPNRLIAGVESGEDETTVMKRLIETFGANRKHPLSPIELSKHHVLTLRQMGDYGTYYAAIADAIEQHGQVRIWGRD